MMQITNKLDRFSRFLTAIVNFQPKLTHLTRENLQSSPENAAHSQSVESIRDVQAAYLSRGWIR
ncbi:hypothetical protein ACQ4M3_25665 [Leptolyngbya sp. AN03gr2]|uniref:hypothetical protein n=1 Tax=unclassified Leptolyngbya TaxID=2650499 RepID=UPI003D321FF1